MQGSGEARPTATVTVHLLVVLLFLFSVQITSACVMSLRGTAMVPGASLSHELESNERCPFARSESWQEEGPYRGGFGKAVCSLLPPGLIAAVAFMLLALGGCLRAGFRVTAECLPLHFLSLLPWGMSAYSGKGTGDGQVMRGRPRAGEVRALEKVSVSTRDAGGRSATHPFIHQQTFPGAFQVQCAQEQALLPYGNPIFP